MNEPSHARVLLRLPLLQWRRCSTLATVNSDLASKQQLTRKSKMKHTFSPTFIALIVFIYITSVFTQGLLIADQHAFVGKLYYFRLPLTKAELNDIVDVKVTETNTESDFEKWFLVLKSSDKIELIGLPGSEEKKLHFFHIHIKKKDGTFVDDVFVLDVIDKPAIPVNIQSDVPKDCIIQITPTFASIRSVWKIIQYLMPTKLQQEIDLESQFHRKFSDTDDANSLIQQWSQSLLSVTCNVEPNKERYFKVTIEQQQCNKNEKAVEKDDLEYRLKKLGVEYNLVKIVKTVNLFEDSYEDDDFKNQLSTKLWSHLSLQSNAANVRNHYRRDIPHIHSTPSLYSEWINHVTTAIPSSVEDDHYESIDSVTVMTRVVPILTSPTLPTPQSSQLFSGANEHTIQLKPSQRSFEPHFISSTPVIFPDPPTDMLTPTPSLPNKVSVEVSTIDMHRNDFSSSFVVTPTQTISFLSTTAIIDPSLTTSDSLTSASMLPSTTVTESSPEETTKVSTTPLTKIPRPNKGPFVQKVIPKLNLTSGKYWRYQIPADTFMDFEDGNTRKLNLTFLIWEQNEYLEVHPPADFWIQFDPTNQYLFAIPTDKYVGKHRFSLVVTNSKGKSLTEVMEIHVRQHSSFRAFHHKFTLYQVKWDSHKYPFLIEAVSKLARKVVRVFGDNNLNSFTVQSIENVENMFTVSWTNSSLPAYPCPKEIIHNLYGKIADLTKPTEGITAKPSRSLWKVTNPEFEIQGVGLRLLSSCSVSPPTEGSIKTPSLRNPIDELKYKFGEVFRYEILKDMFFFPRGENIRELDISLLTMDGHKPTPGGFISFDAKKQEIYGLAMGPNDVYSNQFQIVARDPETGVDLRDAFIISFAEDLKTKNFEMSVSVALINETEMDMDMKVLLAWKISTSLLSDSDPSSVRVLDIKKYPFVNESNVSNEELLEETNDHLHERFKRDIDQQHYYELTWTNTSDAIAQDNKCPSDIIQNSIVQPIFGNSPKSFASLKEKFEPDIDLLHVGFKPMGNCIGIMSERQIGEKPVAIPTTTTMRSSTTAEVSSPTDVAEVLEEHPEEEVRVTAVITVVIVVVIIVAICLGILAVLWIRFMRKQEKSRFELSHVIRSSNGSLAEREAFLQKGRVPVIMESELHQQQQRMISPVIMPPQDSYKQQMQQSTPMRTAQKKPYQPYSSPTHQNQRIQPPPYYGGSH